jgi:hypothetical protein
MSILSEYTRWKREVASGDLSKKSIDKLKDKHIAKPEKEYMGGVEHGAKKILNKHGVEVKRTEKGSATGPHVDEHEKVVHLPQKGHDEWMKRLKAKRNFDMSKEEYHKEEPIALKHDADEIAEKNRQKKKFGEDGVGSITVKKSGSDSKSKHYGLRVLKKEKKLTDLTSRLYGVGNAIRRDRQKSGEYDAVSKMSNGQMRRIDRKAAKLRTASYKSAKDDFDKVKNRKTINIFKKVADLKTAKDKLKKSKHVNLKIGKK